MNLKNYQKGRQIEMQKVEKWKRYEMTLDGPVDGNPYTEVSLIAEFVNNGTKISVKGFYDGKGKYKVRYMPQKEGMWEVKTGSNIAELNEKTDVFECTEANKENHGPVVVSGKTHFSYADGKGYIPFGTTAYAWTVQPENIRQETLATLKQNKFNKIRMTVFPKNYSYNTEEPELYPYEGGPKKTADTFDFDDWMVSSEDIGFDFSRFIPEYFKNLERYIDELDNLGIEADLIIFHPYDHWGFARMGKKYNKLYIQYLVARLASFKNVWWSLANEYDLMDLCGQIRLDEWDSIGKLVQDEDPSGHLLSIHNWYDPPQHKDNTKNWYDYSKPWITHLSVQNDNVFNVPKWVSEYRKPVIIDECRYEGNIEFGWGDNTAKGMMDFFWRIILRGGGATHGETYIDKPNTKRPIWWAHGGKLYGDSQKRINYFKDILDKNGFSYIVAQATEGPHWELAAGSTPDLKKFIVYFGENQPEFEILDFLPKEKKYSAQLINAWDMTESKLNQKVTANEVTYLPRNEFNVLILTEDN